MMAGVDILILLSNQYKAPSSVEAKQSRRWRETFLTSYDVYQIDGSDFAIERRKVIENTFNQLQDLIDYWESL